ncbi:hypothetical protein DUQ00_09150 [Salmonella bongori]|uniref:Uncharacterized protein n=2 Tax=Salmonella bongori TaxID=54736 RepID=A0A702BMB0_SALBN|nr:hypothetical protein [Salmonella bongori]ECG8259228.1 hypothetical protein [Salmonella bongori serovar 48:i:-]HAC6694017.1 hypothetical protein [Salmonella bongori serovar 44:r:-]ECC8923143.1 hypothetical protein [Salmonella bongori]ECC9596494.1 hypothetical protein [Salmonella bongori]
MSAADVHCFPLFSRDARIQQNLSPGCVYNFARKLTAKSITFLRQINIETFPLLNSPNFKVQ